MTRKENLVAELNLIQNQIQRMAGNSFIIKGWYMTFVSAFMVYIFSKPDFNFLLIFWGIVFLLICLIYDCYFLYLERLYREKYSWIINNIDNDKFLFNLNPYEKEMSNKLISPINVFLSKSILGFYFSQLLILIIGIIYVYHKDITHNNSIILIYCI